MGVITDLVIGNPSEAERICEKLITLTEILKIPGKRQLKKRPIFASPHGSCLFLLPDELVDRLSSLSKSELDDAAASWAEMEDEFRWQGWPDEVIHTLLQKLRTLSQKAPKKKLSLLLRHCP